jgi:hypothetical protein
VFDTTDKIFDTKKRRKKRRKGKIQKENKPWGKSRQSIPKKDHDSTVSNKNMIRHITVLFCLLNPLLWIRIRIDCGWLDSDRGGQK